MVLQTQQTIRTTDEFIAYAFLPENAARNLEFINGKVIEKLGSTTQNAQIPMLLSATIITHYDTHGILVLSRVRMASIALTIGALSLISPINKRPYPPRSLIVCRPCGPLK